MAVSRVSSLSTATTTQVGTDRVTLNSPAAMSGAMRRVTPREIPTPG